MLDGQTDMCGTRILHAEHPKELMTRWPKQSIPHPITTNVDIRITARWEILQRVEYFATLENSVRGLITHRCARQASVSFHPSLPQHEVLF